MPMFIDRSLAFGLCYFPKASTLIESSIPHERSKTKSQSPKARQKKAEASDPRNRLPPSQLGSPYLQGGQVRARSIFGHQRFGNSGLPQSGPGSFLPP